MNKGFLRWVVSALLLCTFAGWGNEQASRSIAVLSQSKAPAWADLVVQSLNTALAKKSFEPVERKQLAKVLLEHKLSAAGMVRNPLSVGKVVGARYFAYVHAHNNGNLRKAHIILVQTSSGNVLMEDNYSLPAIDDDAKLRKTAATIAERSLVAVTKADKLAHLPSAAVLTVTNQSASERLDFLEASVTGILNDILTAKGYRVLRRHHVDRLAEETTLGMSGMVRPDARALGEAADLKVSAVFREEPSEKHTLANTAIKLRLTLAPKAGTSSKSSHQFTAGAIKTLLAALRKTIPKGADVTKAANVDEMEAARTEAAGLMAQLRLLPYMESQEEHEKVVKIAERVIFLDPSIKDAYFFLANSLDPLARRGKHWGESPYFKRAQDAFMNYLQFPRTDRKRVAEVFHWLSGTYLFWSLKDKPDEQLAFMAEEIRWHHSINPKDPFVREPDSMNRWWTREPKRRLKWYDWIDQLYGCGKNKSVCAVQRWHAHMQLDQPDKAAKYFYMAVVGRKEVDLRTKMLPSQIQPNAEDMAEHLTKAQAEEMMRIVPEFLQKRAPLQAMYGNHLGNHFDIWNCFLNADGWMLKAAKYKTAQTKPVDLPQHVYSTFIGRTKAGLWIHGAITRKKLALWHSPKPGEWRVIQLHPDASRTNIAIIDIQQLGDDVFFATPWYGAPVPKRVYGVHALNLKTEKWRRYSSGEGLGTDYVTRIIPVPGKKALFFYGWTFRTRYENGKLFLAKRKVPRSVGTVFCGPDAEMFKNSDGIHIYARDKRRIGRIGERQVRKVARVVPAARSQIEGFGGSADSERNPAVVGDRVFFPLSGGLLELNAKGKIRKLWRRPGFQCWEELGAVVEGNCPLPPTRVDSVVVDDQKPELLWVLSKYWEVGGLGGLQIEYMIPKPDPKAMTLITAFDTRTNRFSQPLHVPTTTVQMEPFGDHLYLTGAKVYHTPKANWKTTTQIQPDGDKIRVSAADTVVGKAAEAFFRGDRERAEHYLQKAVDRGIATTTTSKMLNAIKRMK